MKSVLKISGVILVFVLLSSCGLFLRYDDETLSGTLDGSSWTLVTGVAEDDGDTISFDMYGQEEADACTSYIEGDKIMGTVPSAVGEYKVGLLQDAGVTLYAGGTNYIMTKSTAKIEILSISDSEITGQLVAKYDSDNEVSGQFTLEVCAK